MQKITLSADKRTLSGRKVKTLRAKGTIPATIYGKGVKSESVSVSVLDFRKVYAKSGNTGLIDIILGKENRPVLVHTVQVHPVSNAILHIEFHQVDLKEKVHAKVPLVHVGTSPTVELKLGALLTTSDEVEVEALPGDLPENISVDVSKLTEVGQELNVGDLQMPKGVTLLTAVTVTIAKIEALITHEVEEKKVVEVAGAPEEAENTTQDTGKATDKSSEPAKPPTGEKGKDK